MKQSTKNRRGAFPTLMKAAQILKVLDLSRRLHIADLSLPNPTVLCRCLDTVPLHLIVEDKRELADFPTVIRGAPQSEVQRGIGRHNINAVFVVLCFSFEEYISQKYVLLQTIPFGQNPAVVDDALAYISPFPYKVHVVLNLPEL